MIQFGGSRRNKTMDYKLSVKTVFKKFFMATLNIGETAISVFVKKQAQGSPLIDRRGVHGNQRKIDLIQVNLVFDHIKSFPAVESLHMCKKSEAIFSKYYGFHCPKKDTCLTCERYAIK